MTSPPEPLTTVGKTKKEDKHCRKRCKAGVLTAEGGKDAPIKKEKEKKTTHQKKVLTTD